MTFRKVTPAALKVNVKKFWQVLLVPWHVWAPIWVHFAPWWSIFPVKNRFSHIFPVPGGLPFLTVILTVKLARLLSLQHYMLILTPCQPGLKMCWNCSCGTNELRPQLILKGLNLLLSSSWRLRLAVYLASLWNWHKVVVSVHAEWS